MFEIISSKEFEVEIRIVKAFSFVPTSILKLESQLLSTEEQVAIIPEVQETLSKNKVYSDRFVQIIARNPDFDYSKSFNALTANESEKNYSFIPLATVDVERSFSKHKDILTDRRKSFNVETLDKYMFIYYNSNK